MLTKYFLFFWLVIIATGNELCESNHKLASLLYKQLNNSKKNLAFSPLALYSMLLIIRESATGATQNNIQRALNLPDKSRTASLYRDIQTVFNEVPDANMQFATKLHVSSEYTLKERFARYIRDYYHSETGTISKDNRAAAHDINNWIRGRTMNKIKDFLTPINLDSSSGVLTVNAAYFNVPWAFPFSENKIATMPFHISPTKSVKRKFMTTTNIFDYHKSDRLQCAFLKINFKNRRFAIFFALPYSRTGIKDLEDKLQTLEVNHMDGMMERTQVKVAIPTFRIRNTFDLGKPLKTAGFGDMFYRNDLTEIVENKNLHVSAFLHQFRLEVNRTRTKASAISQRLYQRKAPQETFVADHPFLFFITVDVVPSEKPLITEYAVLFMGKMCNP